MTQGALFGCAPTARRAESTEAQEAKRRAIEQVAANAGQRYLDAAYRRIEVLAAEGKPFTAREVRRLLALDHVPPPREPRALGVAFHRAAAAGLIVKCGTEPSGERQNHHRPLQLWVRAR